MILAAAAAVSLGACANVQPADYHRDAVRQGEYLPASAENEMLARELARWAEVPAVTVVDVPASSLVPRSVAQPVPPALLAMPVSVQMTDDARTMADLAFLLAAEGVPLVVDSRDETLEEARVPLFAYSGPLAGLLAQVEAGAGVTAVGTSAGGILLTRAVHYEFPVPAQQPEAVAALIADLTAAGAVEPTWSARTSAIRYRAPVQLQADVIAPMLARARENLAQVRVQMAMVSVTGTRESARGFDWTKFRADLASKQTAEARGDEFAGAAGRMLSAVGPMVAGAGTLSAGGVVLGLAGAFDFLDKMGQAQTRQQFDLLTFSGVPVAMRDGNSIPYIESVSSTATQSTTTGSAESSTVETGSTLTLLPSADIASGLISTTVKAEFRQLVAFRELSAGADLGTLTQPETREHVVESHIVGRAGEVVILDGSRLAELSGDADSPLGVDVLAHENKDGRSASMFILLRQVVTVFRPILEEAR